MCMELKGLPGLSSCEHVPMEMQSRDPLSYLRADNVIQSDSPQVAILASELRAQHRDDIEFVRAAFEWVRDRIQHSIDVGDPRVTITASDVLQQGVGLCFAKSHLLTALLRSQGVPAGLCYQRLKDGDSFIIHGLSSAYLDGNWHRLDPRGNKPGVDAQFCLDQEQIAWQADPGIGEVDYPQVYRTPARGVLEVLQSADNSLILCETGLPSAIQADNSSE